MIKGTNISLTYPHQGTQRTVLNTISFEIPKGRITAFIGRSGAGKTSILRCCAHLTTSYTGTLTLQNRSLSSYKDQERVHTVGFVFQQFNLFPHMNIMENCTAALKYEGLLSESAIEDRAQELLALVGMSPYLSRYPHQLSGGQQQRVAIARALMLRPSVLLFDEPTSALDPESTTMLATVLKNLLNHGITVAYASHDMQFIAATRDRIYLMEHGTIIDTFDSAHQQMSDSPKIDHFLRSALSF